MNLQSYLIMFRLPRHFKINPVNIKVRIIRAYAKNETSVLRPLVIPFL